MTYGNPTEIKNNLTFEDKMEITEEMNVTELLEKNKF